MVRLGRVGDDARARDGVSGAAFNPTVVRLGLGKGRTSQPVSSWPFQSHCGAIGTGQPGYRPELDADFQSHCGAIGTAFSDWLWAQLKELSIPLWCDWDRAPGFANPNSWRSFQSHCGAIGTMTAREHVCDRALPFNPTVVRLGPSPRRPRARPLLSFNPTVVRLGLQARHAGARSRLPFNPTVVRLGQASTLTIWT